MSKIICDVCGSVYPETAEQCPICGCARPEDVIAASDDALEESAAAGTYNYVKGGRFSKANVKKRNKAAAAAAAAYRQHDDDDDEEPYEEEKAGTSKGLVAVLILLLLAIVAVLGYIYISFFAPDDLFGSKGEQTQTTTTAATTEQTEPVQTTEATTEATTEPEDLSCTGLTLPEKSVTLNKIGSGWLLNVIPTPSNTTDTITYASADESVATVTDEGKVVAVAEGETVITITCGEVVIECPVVCEILPEPTQTAPEETGSDETEPDGSDSDSEFKLNREDITFVAAGDSWKLYDGDISVSSIYWYSDDESVATIRNGRVYAVGEGKTEVHGEYNGKKVSCIIRCDFTEE